MGNATLLYTPPIPAGYTALAVYMCIEGFEVEGGPVAYCSCDGLWWMNFTCIGRCGLYNDVTMAYIISDSDTASTWYLSV